ncbi:Octaprenyl diphosphate synthase [Minicystis rosea]|nr:Octaprenyl diphosphate synthase [Minicystis rosea]
MTTTFTESSAPPHDDVFAHLEDVCAGRGLDTLAGKLIELRTWLAGDLADVERAIAAAGSGDTPAHKSVRHLLDQDGKRLRPICVALASRAGQGFTPAARTYAVAVELVHNATLLHDDVVDVGDVRRGHPAARVVYGNAASIFGGDWLLTDALCRVQSAGQADVLGRLLEVIKEMVIAESLQLARRGKVKCSASDYFRIIDGKTASLFRWAMFAGARAGGVGTEATQALEEYGQKLGVAFQLVDDLLDFAGDPAATGKALLTDLREGKMTYPLILAMERDPSLAPDLERSCASEDAEVDPELAAHVARAMARAGVTDDCLELATKLCREAIKSLSVVPTGRARTSLESVALSVPRRRK